MGGVGGEGVWEENNMNPKYKIWYYWFLEEIVWNQNENFDTKGKKHSNSKDECV
jgi:hypothetical protein